MADSWGGSWGASWGVSWGSGAAPAPDTATPGYLPRDFTDRKPYRRKPDDVELRIEPPQPDKPPVDKYAEESQRIATAIERERADIKTYQAEIDRLEAIAAERYNSEIIAKKLLLQRQALLKAQVQEAVLLEEMQIIDVAFMAMVAYRMLQ